ncbi:MAG: endonuclease/exonuclease/phosphatase family protein [Pseudomonadota bacterium]
MIVRVEKVVKKFRRLVCRSRWLAKILGFPLDEGSATRPGLIMIQIDGLSQYEFRKALYKGELPFLKRLIDRENYQEHSHYSGLPACTPAVQGEIFYGVKTIVPAFAFRDPDHKRVVRMYEPAIAAGYEQRLDEQCDEPLLKGGSGYCNIFTGGAAEPHFCAATMGVKSALEAANPFALALLIITNFASVLRIIALVFIELGVSIVDFISGVSRGRNFLKELKFIPTRIGICIVLRELLVIGAKIDMERGLPIVHLNFIGFDEQSHRRGPTSAFAHWTLKGIDYAIKRVWQAAHISPRRQYDVWIYSDHGQCIAKSFLKTRGYPVEDAINQSFAKLEQKVPLIKMLSGKDVQRCCLMGSHKEITKHGHEFTDADLEEAKLEVADLGPVAFIYPDRKYSPVELTIVAQALATDHRIPVVVTEGEDGTMQAITAEGIYKLPDQIEELFGAEHPFVADIGEDLLGLCGHPNAGALVLLGWRKGMAESMTFVPENGSHAGLTHEETNPFSLLPKDTQLPDNGKQYLRPGELRLAALHFLKRKLFKTTPRSAPFTNTEQKTLKVMTYNVHSCIGLDGKLDLARISRVIAQAEPDVVCLQELDLLRVRSGKDDQAQLIAELLEMNYHFHPAMHMEEEQYGDAILTHLPMRTVKTGVLPGVIPGSKREPRGALWVSVSFDGKEVQIINTHLGLSASEQQLQIQALLGDEWLGSALNEKAPVIFCGDFNFHPGSRPYRRVVGRMKDAQLQLANQKPKNTFYSRFPLFRIDHIFINEQVEVVAIDVPKSRTAKNASDHLPLMAEFRII